MSRREPDWLHHLPLSVTDESDDDPARNADPAGSTRNPDPEQADPEQADPANDDEPPARGLAVRWCALLAVLAVLLAAAGGSLLTVRRHRTVTSTVVGYRQPRGILTGCPREDVCQPLSESDAELADLRPPELAGATLLVGSVLIDSATSATIRSVQLLTADGLTLLLTGQCVIGGAPVPAMDTDPVRSADGSTVLALVRPSRQPGCSASLVARVPAGRPLPDQLLRRLAEELPQRLVNG
ncbi:MAG TPA: hypothetical protein VFU36_09890 [Jatrophihabitans sp.]|nr:hypothetical protein [Jatrophihabitans sp.]